MPSVFHSSRIKIILFLLVACIFLPTLRNDFVIYDDLIYLHQNPIVTTPDSKAAFLTAWLRPYEQNYTPLLWSSFRLIYDFFGINPLAFHLPSLLLHATNTVVLMSVMLKLGAPPRVALIASIVWAIHPQRVEAVSWVSAFKDPSSTFFALCSTWLWLQARKYPTQWKWWIASATTLAISLLFKQGAMTLPFVLFTFHFLTREKSSPVLFRQHLPLIILGITAASAATWANHGAFTHATYLNFQSAWDQPAHAAAALSFNLYKTFVPIGLIPDYPVPQQTALWATSGALALVLAGLALIRHLSHQQHLKAFCLLWALGLWLPASGIIPTPLEFTSDRLSYLPATMLMLYFALALTSLVKKNSLQVATLLALLIPLATLTIRQQARWHCPESMINHCLKITYRHYPSIINDAVLRLKRGEDPNHSINSLENAIKYYPHRSTAYHRLIQIHRIRGEHRQAKFWTQQWQENCSYDPATMKNF